MMDEWFLRIEGVNLSATVYDTQDLGATQGASLALLEAPEQATKKHGLQPVFVGASQGLFKVPQDRAEAIAEDARCFLRTTDPFRHLSFVVDVADSEEAVTALNRRSQMQSLSVVLPSPGIKGVCPVDRIRPAELADQEDLVSASVKARRVYRRKVRRAFYTDTIGVSPASMPKADAMSHSFENIVKAPGRGAAPEALRNKLAVLYFDGNGFTALRNEIGVETFSAKLKDLRRDLMEKKMIPAMGGLEFAETILWGGDEMMWVVPSWRMWTCLDVFFDATKDWKIDGKRLTHAGGVVVCHYKTPIRLVKDLAEVLAYKAKGGRDRTAVQMEILESLDIPEGYLDRQRRQLFGPCAPEAAFSHTTESWAGLTPRLGKIRQNFPRSQLYRLLKQARDGGALKSHRPDEVVVVIKALEEILKDRDTGCTVADLVGSEAGGGDLDTRLIRLAEIATLWDYHLPETKP